MNEIVRIAPLNKVKELAHPRRIKKYVLIWVKSGTLSVYVDDNTFVLKKNTAITITSGQVHYIQNRTGATGWVLEFTYDFFCKNDNDIELIFHNSLFCHFAMNEVIALNTSEVLGDQLVLFQLIFPKKCKVTGVTSMFSIAN
jgi:AraC family transcriptional regulator, transcriptional activator of pobA